MITSIVHADDTEGVRNLLEQLHALDPDLARGALCELLTDGRESHIEVVRAFQATLPEPLLELPDRDSVEAIASVLRGHPDVVVRVAAAARLGRIEGRESLEALRAGLEDPATEVVVAALDAASRLDPHQAISMARTLLEERCEVPMLQAVAEFLGRKGHEGFLRLFEVAGAVRPQAAQMSAAVLASRFPAETIERCAAMADVDVALEQESSLCVLLGMLRSEEVKENPEHPTRSQEVVRIFGHLASHGSIGAAVHAIRGLALLRERSWRSHFDALLPRVRYRHRRLLLQVLVDHGEPEDLPRAIALLRDKCEEARASALRAVARLAPKREIWLQPTVWALKDPEWEVRQAAVEVLRDRGDRSDLDHVVLMFNDPDEDVRQSALSAALRLDPERAADHARSFLTDRDPNVVGSALVALSDALPSEEIPSVVFGQLRSSRGEGGRTLLDWTQRHTPARLSEAMSAAVASRSPGAQCRAVELMGESGSAEHLPILLQLAQGRDQDVRLAALEALVRIVPNEADRVAREALHDESALVREKALDRLVGRADPELLEEFLRLARDEDEDVRRKAITALANYDDPRVVSEIVSSLNDLDEDVRQRARELIDGKHGRVPALERIAPDGDTEAAWHRLRERADEVNRWASRIGQELLGKPVVVHQYRQAIGRTSGGRNRRTVEIEVSDAAVTSGHPHGQDIMRGIALHEIGHHLCDFGARGYSTTRGIARAEGIQSIYDILLDERLERVLRARRPEWGRYIDRLNSFIFARRDHRVQLEEYAAMVGCPPEAVGRMIESGELAGRLESAPGSGGDVRVVLRDGDLLAIPGALPPLMAFLTCLVGSFDPRIHPDPKVAQAIDEVPANLKDLPHAEVLETARRIAKLLGRDERHKQDLVAFRRWKRQMREVFRQWGKLLDRMAESGMGPRWMRRDAPRIRAASLCAPRCSRSGRGGKFLNLGGELSFPPMEREVRILFDPDRHAELVGSIRPHVRRLRTYFERLGRGTIEEHAATRGRRLDLVEARKAGYSRRPNLLVLERDEIRPNAYIGVLIDRSGSMVGSKIELARAFGALVAESARGLAGIEGHVNAFDDDTFYNLGDFQRNSIALLEADGGNNDSGALQWAAELAFQSRKRNKLLLMISDGSPAECTFESLKALVEHLTRRYGIVCAQAAVEGLSDIAFPHFVDLSRYRSDEAIARFGSLLMDLTRDWR